MSEGKNTVQLFEYCFSVRETLRGAIQGDDPGDLNESEKVAMKDLEVYVDQPWPPILIITNTSRIMCDIERVLLTGSASVLHTTNYDKERVESYVQDIQHILGTLHVPSPPPGEDVGVDECASHLPSVNPHETVATSVSGAGVSLPYAFTGLVLDTDCYPTLSLPNRSLRTLNQRRVFFP